MLVITKSCKETHTLAERIVREILGKTSAQERTVVVALYGDLGSGKTSFVQGAARAFGIPERVLSPTFIIERVYAIPSSDPGLAQGRIFTHFIHIDCYRLKNSEELKKLGWNDIINNPKNIIFVEWAEIVENILPEGVVKIYFEFVDENERKIEIKDKNK